MPPKSEAEHAAMQRRIRHNIFQSGAYPYGEKQLNPQRKETAYEYSEWARGQQSHSIHEGSYRDMLEAEERHLGTTSYPPGHPRREIAFHGYGEEAEMPPTPPQKPSGAPQFAESGVPVPKVAGTHPEPVRPNRFTTSCARCGEKVLPGEGQRIREPERWSTVHYPRCPT